MRTLPQPLTKNTPPKTATGKLPDETFILGDDTKGALVRVITPVLGGGVESFTPDAVDVVRVPSVRGALRWWWRALHPGLDLKTLRERERKVWGGVGRDAKEESSASPVRVEVRVMKTGKVVPAGHHLRDDRGGYKALPEWKNRKLGYGLFPLQRSNDERRGWKGSGDMPTKEWRQELEFELRVRVVRRDASALDAADVEGVRDAVTLWLAFGGYGARTRRGFGALDAEAVTLAKALAILQRVGGEAPTDRPTLAGCVVYEGAPRRSAEEAHAELLGALQEFRQGTRFGRNPGEGNRPGRSRWPEADSMRVLSGRRFRAHPPAPSHRSPSAPRAAFGMPLLVQFKDAEDKAADGSITSGKGGERWASPVLLRPMRRGNEFVPVVVVLSGHRPASATMKVGDRVKQVPVVYDDARDGGAHDPVRSALVNARGDALAAFTRWLYERRFNLIAGGAR